MVLYRTGDAFLDQHISEGHAVHQGIALDLTALDIKALAMRIMRILRPGPALVSGRPRCGDWPVLSPRWLSGYLCSACNALTPIRFPHISPAPVEKGAWPVGWQVERPPFALPRRLRPYHQGACIDRGPIP
jgi:hypothetical protein